MIILIHEQIPQMLLHSYSPPYNLMLTGWTLLILDLRLAYLTDDVAILTLEYPPGWQHVLHTDRALRTG